MSFSGTVLLADDEAHIRKFVGLIVKQLGATQVLEAANGAEAVELFAREKPDLVLLDVNMPVLDGLGALRKIHELDPDSVVVMLTSLTTRQTVEGALELGAVNYIRKDASKDDIVKELNETIARCFESDNPSTP